MPKNKITIEAISALIKKCGYIIPEGTILILNSKSKNTLLCPIHGIKIVPYDSLKKGAICRDCFYLKNIGNYISEEDINSILVKNHPEYVFIKSESITNINSRMLFVKCKNGHEKKIKASSIYKNDNIACQQCKNNELKSIALELIDKNNFSLPIDWIPPVSTKDRFLLICNKHGQFSKNIINIRQANKDGYNGCSDCRMDIVKSNKILPNNILADRLKSIYPNYNFISCDNNEGVDISSMTVQCNNNHTFSLRINRMYKKKFECPECTGISEHRIKTLIQERGYDIGSGFALPLISTDKISICCSIHGDFSIGWSNFQSGDAGCHKCSKISQRSKKLANISEISEKIQKKGLTFIEVIDVGIGIERNIRYLCKKGHENIYPHSYVLRRFPCHICSKQVTIHHKEIYEYIQSIYDQKVIVNDRKALAPVEIDIYMPDRKFGIEFDGLYWHSNVLNNNVDKKNINKIKKCQENNINLLCIFEDEWKNPIKRELIKHMISYRLGILPTNKLRASKLTIKKLVKNKEYEDFFDKYHLDGHVKSSFAYGLFYNEEMITCMSFRKSFSDKCWEIARFANNYNYLVHGAAGKIIKKFKEDFNERLVTYSNNRLSHGNVYKQIGFTEITKTFTPSYYYTDFKVRIWRFKCKRINDPEILALYPTETAQALGGVFSRLYLNHGRPMYKIYDYGHRKWEL